MGSPPGPVAGGAPRVWRASPHIAYVTPTRGYLTLKWGSLTPNLLKCTRCRLAPNLLKSATSQQIR